MQSTVLVFAWSLLSRHLPVQSLYKGNTRAVCEICSKSTKYYNDFIDVVLFSLMLTLSRFYTMFWYFHC